MSTICMTTPNEVKVQKGNKADECRVENTVSIVQNMFNYNNLTKNQLPSFYMIGLIKQFKLI